MDQLSEHDAAHQNGEANEPFDETPRAEEVAPRKQRRPRSDVALDSYVDRLEKLEEDKRALNEDISALLLEAGKVGLHKKALKTLVKLRLQTDKQEAAQREYEACLHRYRDHYGLLFDDTPLGQFGRQSDG